MVERTTYAQSVAGIGRCFDNAGRFTLGDECPLPTSSIWAESGGGSFRGGDLPNSLGATPSVSVVGRHAGTARTALVPFGDGRACQREETYSGAATVALRKAAKPGEALGIPVDVDLPETEGHYLLCAVRGHDYEGAAAVLFEVDRTPPLIAATAEVEDIGEGNLRVTPQLNPPEISAVRSMWGPPDTVNCADPTGFYPADPSPKPLAISAANLPVRYCIYGQDAAGNATGIAVINLPQG